MVRRPGREPTRRDGRPVQGDGQGAAGVPLLQRLQGRRRGQPGKGGGQGGGAESKGWGRHEMPDRKPTPQPPLHNGPWDDGRATNDEGGLRAPPGLDPVGRAWWWLKFTLRVNA